MEFKMLDKRSECLWPDTTTIEVATVQSWKGRVFVSLIIQNCCIYTQRGERNKVPSDLERGWRDIELASQCITRTALRDNGILWTMTWFAWYLSLV